MVPPEGERLGWSWGKLARHSQKGKKSFQKMRAITWRQGKLLGNWLVLSLKMRGLRQRAHAVVCCGEPGGLARSAGGSTALLQVAPQTVSKALPLSSHCIVGVGVMYRTKARCRSN